MSRILFGLIPAWGHAAPTVAIAQRLMAAGHTVAYAAHPSMRKLLDSAGLELLEEFQWGDNLVQGMELMRQGYSQQQILLRLAHGRPFRIFLHRLEEGTADFRKLIRTWQPDLVVNDIVFHPGLLAAEAEGILHATSCPVILPHWISPGLPPYGSGKPPRQASSLGSRLGSFAGGLLRRIAGARLNAVRRAHGIPKAAEPVLAHSKYLTLAYTTEALEYPRPELPREIHYIGPSISDRRGDHDLPFPWAWLDASPLVLVSLGTIFNGDRGFFEKAAEASRGQSWRMVMKVSPHLPAGSWPGGPENVLAVHEQPQLALLDRASLMVSHAGDNSVNEALAKGVPLVLAPAGVDQAEVAQRVVEAGAGLRIALGSVTVLELRETIRRVLDEQGFRSNAERIAADFARCDGPRVGAALLERLISSREPVLRGLGTPPTCYAQELPGNGRGWDYPAPSAADCELPL
ncbi:MAG: hypothetical protein IPL96_15370 [Holophagaceae bacterium]|nr:hypothetical protein [Holophagaceae bacterium]